MTLAETLAKAKVYDLARPLEAATPTSPNHPPFRMALQRRHGDMVRADGGSASNELLVLGGHTGTHMDALCHVSHNGRLHGDVSTVEAVQGGRFAELGIDTVAPFFRRGILLDGARAIGVPHLDRAVPLTADVLEAACEAQQITIERGDVVLVRSGWPVGRYDDAHAFVGHASGVPGIDESGATWLAAQGVSLVGGDTIALEYLPPGNGHAHLPAHRILLVENGIPILELLDLEELAAGSAFEFLFVAAPIKIVGATGAPIRPLAVTGLPWS
jgi:kynurenine formamidase